MISLEENRKEDTLRLLFICLSPWRVLKPKSLFYFKLHICPVVCVSTAALLSSLFLSYRNMRAAQRDMHYPFLFGTRWDTKSRLLSRYPLTSASICLLCKSRPTGADVDGNTNAETSPSTISPTNTLNGEQLVIARVAHT